VALLWFGGIFTAVRKLLKYDEIHQPFRLDGEENDDQRQVRDSVIVFAYVCY